MNLNQYANTIETVFKELSKVRKDTNIFMIADADTIAEIIEAAKQVRENERYQ